MTQPRIVLWGRRAARRVVGVTRRFYADNCLQQASALAYVSLLSLVPLLALMFAVLKGLGVQRRLEPLLLSRLALSPEIADRIVAYIDRTNVGTLGALGAAALVFTVISVLGSVEASFNQIWRVRRNRTWWRKATDYLSTVLLTPFLLLVAVAMTSSLQQQALLRWVLHTEYIGTAVLASLRFAPIVINVLALAILYAVMPNRRPYVPGIAVGAVAAGCAWQVVQWGYVTLQVGVARYNAIYGALSQLPVTLVWLYLSWIVVLAGAELAAGYELDAGTLRGAAAPQSRWVVALHLLLLAVDHFRSGDGVLEPRMVARRLHLGTDLVTEIAETLEGYGLLASIDGEGRSFLLARDPQTIALAEIDPLLDVETIPSACDPRVKALVEQVVAQRRNAWGHVRLIDIASDTALVATAEQSERASVPV